jgi:hypothetical protein
MRNAILSSIWSLIGGLTAFYACSWIGDWTIEALSHGELIIRASIDLLIFFTVPVSICVASWWTRLFYAGKLPGYRPEK